MGDEDGDAPGVQIIADRNSHVRLCLAVLVVCDAGGEARIGEVARAVAPVKKVRAGIVGDQQVQFAVMIEIGPDCRQAIAKVCVGNARVL